MSRSTKRPDAAGLPPSAGVPSVRLPGASGSFRRVTLEDTDPRRARLVQLVDRLSGDIVLRYVAGRRVLDLGHGSPDVTAWVRPRAANLHVIDSEQLDEVMSLPEASFELVFCLRTLPHVGTDEETSLEAARELLREMARVLVPGGTALVQIDNPRSLMGFYYGIRNPMTVVGSGSLVFDPGKGVTRFDTVTRLKGILPPELEARTIHGLRVFVPMPHLLGIPLLGRLLARCEWLARDNAILRHFGAHLLVVLHRLPGQGKAE